MDFLHVVGVTLNVEFQLVGVFFDEEVHIHTQTRCHFNYYQYMSLLYQNHFHFHHYYQEQYLKFRQYV